MRGVVTRSSRNAASPRPRSPMSRVTPLVVAVATLAFAPAALAAFSTPQRPAGGADAIFVQTSVDADGTQRAGWLEQSTLRLHVAARAPGAAAFASRTVA